MEIGPGLQLWVGNSSASEQHPLQHSNGPISFKNFHVTQPYAFPVDQLSGLELELESDSEVGVDSGPNWIDDPFPIGRNGLCVSPRPNRATPELLDDPESPRPLVMDMDPPEDLAQNEAVNSNLVDSANTELGPKEEKEHKKDAEASPVRQSPVAYDPIALGGNSDEQHREIECGPNSDLPSVLTPEVRERPQTPTAIASDGFDDRASCGTLQTAAGQLSPTSSPGLKAYVHCSLCNRTFRDKRSLNIHITKTHSNTKVIFGNTHNTDTGGLKLRLVSLPPTKRSRRSASIIEPQPPVQKPVPSARHRTSERELLSAAQLSTRQETTTALASTAQRAKTPVVERISYPRSASTKRPRQSSHITRRHSATRRSESSAGSTATVDQYLLKYNESQAVYVPPKRAGHRGNEHTRPLMDTSLRTTDGSYKCRLCRRVFPSRFSLTGHYKSHYTASQKPYRCDECGQRYTSPSNLHYHRSRNCAVLKLRAMKDKKIASSLPPHRIKLLESKARRAAERRALFHDASQDEKSSAESCVTEDRSTIPGRNGSRTDTPDQVLADTNCADSVSITSPHSGCRCTNYGSPVKSNEASRECERPTSTHSFCHNSEWCATSTQVIKPSVYSSFDDTPKCRHSSGCQPGLAKCDAPNRESHCTNEPVSCLDNASSLHVQLRNLLERACQCESTRQKILAFTTFALISALSPQKETREQSAPESHSNNSFHNSANNNSVDVIPSLSQATGLLSSLTDNCHTNKDLACELIQTSLNHTQMGHSESDAMFTRIHKPMNHSSPSTSSSTAPDTFSNHRPTCTHCSCPQSTYPDQESFSKPFCFSHSTTRSAFTALSEQDHRPSPPCSRDARSTVSATDGKSEIVFPAVMMALNGWPNPNMGTRYLVACSDCDRLFSSPTACRVHYTKAHK